MFISPALEWIAEHPLLVTMVFLAAGVVALIAKFESRLPDKLRKGFFRMDVGLIVVTLLLSALKSGLDEKAARTLDERVAVEHEATKKLEAQMALESELSQQRQAKLEVDLAAAKSELAQAVARADAIEKRAASLEGRAISSKQNALLQSMLKFASKGALEIHANSSDTEALKYAANLEKVLRECGFDPHLQVAMMFFNDGIGPSGLILKISDKGSIPDHANEILNAFNLSGIACHPWRTPGLEPGKLELFVGTRPD